MKIHLTWFRVVAAVAAAAGLSQQPAAAQYLPYRPAPQAQPQPAYGYPAAPQGVAPQAAAPAQAYTAYRTQPQQPPLGQTRYQPTQQNAYQPAPQNPYAAYAPQQQYAPQNYAGYPTYPSMAQQPTVAPSETMTPQNGPATQGETLPGPTNGMVVPSTSAPGMNGTQMNNTPMNGMVEGQQGYPQGYGQGGPGCNCNQQQAYPSTPYGTYAGGGGYQQDGLSGYFNNAGCGDNQWFGGVYWLFMERSNPSFQRFAVQIDDNNVGAYPYYPPASTTVLSTVDTNNDFRSGAEIRFGSTFSIGSACDSGCNGYGGAYGGNSCGCQSSCSSSLYAWEVGYWALDDNENVVSTSIDAFPVDNMRYYGMKSFAGLEYDQDGAGATYSYRPVNDYYDYQMPVDMPQAPAAGDIRVVYQTIRNNFQVQNLELNFLKLPIYSSACAPVSSCGYGNGVGGYGGGGANGGCGDTGCGGCDSCSPAFTIAGLCGVRYMKIDDDFALGDTFQIYDGANWSGNNNLTYAVNVDNRLVGFQLGANMNYCVACKCNLFCDSNFGIYNNDMNVQQRVYGPGNVRVQNTGNDANFSTNKDSVSFLGELRIGGAYDVSCHWRAVAAYRAVAITGLALSTAQMPDNFANESEAGRINSDGSMIIHGVQCGMECRY